MKNRLRDTLGLLALAVLMMTGLSGCMVSDGNSDWWSYPGNDWGYTDPRLGGYWQLVQYNSDYVDADEANYLYFDGNGFGYYYYLYNGYPQRERLRYWCQQSYNSASPRINIQYESNSPLTTNYWFTHNNRTLWLQWQTAGGRMQTYVYDRISYAPW